MEFSRIWTSFKHKDVFQILIPKMRAETTPVGQQNTTQYWLLTMLGFSRAKEGKLDTF